jgi:asparagine synthetase B (glutamine-hydrolysing)
MGALAATLTARSGDERGAGEAMLDAAGHRGSDRQIGTIGRAALGVVTGAGDEASAAGDERLAVVFAGALDDRAALARRVGIDADTASAAELVLAAWRHWGSAAAPGHLRGHYAVAVCDGSTMWAFRDHVGLGALFVRASAGAVAVASQARQAAAGHGGARPTAETLGAALFGSGEPRHTVWPDVERVPGGTLLTATPGRRVDTRYWYPRRELETARLDTAEAAARLADLVATASTRCTRGADAVALSGGLDSGAIAAFGSPAHEHQWGTPLGAVSAVYPSLPSVDERHVIEKVAADLGLPLHLHESRATPLDDLDRWSRLLDAPLFPVSPAEVAELYGRAREAGYPTLLLGNLAELVFDQRTHLEAHLLWQRRWRPLAELWRAERRRGRRHRALAARALSPLVPAVGRLRRDAQPGPPLWLARSHVRELDTSRVGSGGWLDAQVRPTGGGPILPDADEVIGDVIGVRPRYPLLDVDLWEFMLSLPAEVKFPGGTSKGVVRAALSGHVPVDVVTKPKVTFDDALVARIDYETLCGWLLDHDTRIDGVDYRALGDRLATRDLTLVEALWAHALAATHAFLAVH